jgi:hypothetical protein
VSDTNLGRDELLAWHLDALAVRAEYQSVIRALEPMRKNVSGTQRGTAVAAAIKQGADRPSCVTKQHERLIADPPRKRRICLDLISPGRHVPRISHELHGYSSRRLFQRIRRPLNSLISLKKKFTIVK